MDGPAAHARPADGIIRMSLPRFIILATSVFLFVGLGSLVNVAKGNFDTELMFVGLVWLVLLGLLYYAAATLVYRLAAWRLK